jgi:hypothetical protein
MKRTVVARSTQKKHLWRLAFAKASIAKARSACEFIIKNGPSLDEGSYEALVNGVFVLYSRPFGTNNGVGCLPQEFRRYSSPTLQNIHDMILSARNRFVAHTDAVYKYCDERGREKDELLKLELVVSFGDDGMASVRTQVVWPQLLLKVIPNVKCLCEELLEKLSTEESSVIRSLFENRPMLAGRNPINILDES